jgi:HD superfamily phosphohydrolase YqeK
MMRQELIKELETYFGNDKKRINHARNVMHFAEKLLKKEKADRHIVIPASILHDIGIKVAEAKYGSTAGRYQEKEGPPIAKNILLKLGFKKEYIDEICEIIAHHHTPGKGSTQNFKILYDADWLENIKEELGKKDKTELRKMIDKVFLTNTGKALAEKTYLI